MRRLNFLIVVIFAVAIANVEATFAQTYVFFPNSTTINYPVSEDNSIIGFANSADYASHTNGTSPTVIVTTGGGGTFDSLYAQNSSIVNMNGGTYNYLYANDSSKVNLTGGTLGAGLNTAATSKVHISGGHVGFISNGSTVDWSGGTVSGNVSVLNAGTLNVFGSGLSQSLVNPNSGGFSLYVVSGALSDGTLLTNKTIGVQNGGSASLNLVNVPEASTITLSIAMLTCLICSRTCFREQVGLHRLCAQLMARNGKL